MAKFEIGDEVTGYGPGYQSYPGEILAEVTFKSDPEPVYWIRWKDGKQTFTREGRLLDVNDPDYG